jgi:hypothetical protein
MTIESKIDRTNELLEKLLAKFEHVGQSLGEQPRVEQAAAPKPEKTVEKTAPAEAPAEQPLDYVKDVQPKVLKVSSVKGPDTARKLLADLGLKSAKEAKPEQWPAIISACDEALK